MRDCVLRAAAVTALLVLSARPSQAQQAQPADVRAEVERLRAELEALRASYESQLAALTARLDAIDAQKTAAPAAAAAAQPPTAATPAAGVAGEPQGTLPVYGGTASGKVFNPDIAVIGDFLSTMGRNSVNPSKALEMHETEASFQAVVDPYARADFFVSVNEDGAELEEGYVTLTSLPAGLLARVGKMRAAFGKVNATHNHVLQWADRPLVTNNLVAGEEGINDAGVSVARLVPNPWIFLEATGQVFRGDSGDDLFHSSEPSDLSYVGRLRGYGDLSESANVDLGVSYSRGHNADGFVRGEDVGQFTTQLIGVDATIRWRPLRRAIYRSLVGRTEAIWSRRNRFGGPQRAAGFFVSGDYQLARRWYAGARYDRSERAADASKLDSGGALVLTYWPSEFSQVRGQYRRTNYADGPAANEVLFQFQFAIGAHGAHPF
jgi:hypothetical protein